MASPESAELTASEVFPAALAELENPEPLVLLVPRVHADPLVNKVHKDQRVQEVFLVML